MAEEGGFFEVMKDALSAIIESAPVQEMGAELGRMGTQGAAELASALFGGSDAYVAYGRGQDPPSMEGQEQADQIAAPQEQAVQAVEAPQVQQDRGMEM